MSKVSNIKIGSSAAILMIFACLLVAINISVSNLKIRKDLTENRLYTISGNTGTVLKKLDKKVTLKFFYSKSNTEVPIFVKDYAKRVEDVLNEYKLLSGGKVSIEKYDPEPDSDAEEMAERYGIPGQQLKMFGPNFYCGIAAACGNTEASIPVVDPRAEDTLEYNLTRLIYQVAHPERPTIGLISSLPVIGQGPSMNAMGQQTESIPGWVAFNALQESYNIMPIFPDDDNIPTNINMLVIVHPKITSQNTLLAIDQFVLRGGKILLMVDPSSAADIDANPSNPMIKPDNHSTLEPLMSNWGIVYDTQNTVADIKSATRLVRGTQQEDNPTWLSLRDKCFNKNDIISSQLQRLMIPYAGALSVAKRKDVEVTSLIQSSDNAMLIDKMMGRYGADNIRRRFKKADKPFDIAVRLTGKFKTAFPKGITVEETIPTTATNMPTQKVIMPQLKEGTSTIICIADVDMFWDPYCVDSLNLFGYQPKNDNIMLLFNMIEQLSGSTDLIGLRARKKDERMFDVVLAKEEKARTQWQKEEESLMTELQSAQETLRMLQKQKDPSQKTILSKEQKDTIARLKAKELDTKKKLKTLQKNLRRDVENMGMLIKFLNIAVMPILVGMAGITYGIYRTNRRRK